MVLAIYNKLFLKSKKILSDLREKQNFINSIKKNTKFLKFKIFALLYEKNQMSCTKYHKLAKSRHDKFLGQHRLFLIKACAGSDFESAVYKRAYMSVQNYDMTGF